MLKKTSVVILGLIALSRFSFADGMSAEEIGKALPKSYSGTYVWGASGSPWSALVSFADAKVLEDGTVEATGTEHFVSSTNPNDTYDSKVRATINAQTLTFEMEEIYVGTKEGFVPMIYRGKISSDLRYIDASWISTKSEKVTLTLKAAVPKSV
jgi:hypothetical protein